MPQTDPDLLAHVIDALDSGVVILDQNKHVRTWNGWFAQASSIPAAEASGRVLADIFPSARSIRLNAAVEAAFNSGVSSLLTHSLHRTLFPLKTAAGFDMVHDVSVRPL